MDCVSFNQAGGCGLMYYMTRQMSDSIFLALAMLREEYEVELDALLLVFVRTT